MTAEHRLPLITFLVLSGLCLLVAAAGLSGPAAHVPGLPGGSATLLASGAPEHLLGDVLVALGSAPVQVGNDHPVVPTSVALAAAAPAGSDAAAPTSAAPPVTAAHARPAAQQRHLQGDRRVNQASHQPVRHVRQHVRQQHVPPAAPVARPGAAHGSHPAVGHGQAHSGHHPHARRTHRSHHPGKHHGWSHRRH